MNRATHPQRDIVARPHPTFIILQIPAAPDAGSLSAAIASEVQGFVQPAIESSALAVAEPAGESDLAERLLAEVLPAGKATITVEQMGKLLGLGRTGAYEAAKRGDVPSRRINGRIVIPVPALLQWLKSSATSQERS